MGTIGVSHGVSSRVSQNDVQSAASQETVKRRGAGPYLVQSGRSYLFQIRLPKEIGGGRGSRPIRISLGTIPKQRARMLADRLASIARIKFDKLARVQNMSGADSEAPFDCERETHDAYLARIGDHHFEPDLLFPGDNPVAQIAGALRMALRTLEAGADENSPLGHIAAINKQVHRKAAGLKYDAVIVDNADLLREQYVRQGQQRATEEFKARLASGSDFIAQESRDQVSPPVDRIESLEGIVEPGFDPAKALSVDVGAERPNVQIFPDAASGSPAQAVEVLDPLWAELQPGEGRFVTQSLPSGRAPSFLLDRRKVGRPPSSKPLFTEISDGHIEDLISKGSAKTYINRVRIYHVLFVDLIGNHPADTYTASDLQSYIEFIRYWPAEEKDRRLDLTPREMIRANLDLTMKPLSLSTLKGIAVGCVKTALTKGGTKNDYTSPLKNAKLTYPNTAPLPATSSPLGSQKINALFQTGCDSGLLESAMLPLLALVTGRRLALLLNLYGSDIVEKFPGVWVAQLNNIRLADGRWQRVAIKTRQSTKYFVLHSMLVEIGFIEWASALGEQPIFPNLLKLADPEKSASQYMSRLFEKAGIRRGNREDVFHSLRGEYTTMATAQHVDPKTRRMQVGHESGGDEHDNYGFKQLPEELAEQLANLPLPKKFDFSMYDGLDFDAMYRTKRKRGRTAKATPADWKFSDF
jgi:integrase